VRVLEKGAGLSLRGAPSTGLRVNSGDEAISQVLSDKSKGCFAPLAMTQPKTSQPLSRTSAIITPEQEQGVRVPAERQMCRVDLGPVDFIPPGEGRAYVVNDLTIAVFRQRDGRLFATNNHCPHRQGPLADGIFGAGKVICPLHAWKFDLEAGRCLGENVTIPIYPVRVVSGHIEVEIELISSDPPRRKPWAGDGGNALSVETEK
jgi:nitrite reductase (NADH) small subunit